MRQALGLLTAAGLLAGCALPAHNNTLIFATKTDVGLGVSTPSATDAGVSVTLGYKERRAAWVPLWANKGAGNDKEAMGCVEVYTGASTPPGRAASDAEALARAATIACKKGPKFIGDDDAGGGKGSNAANDAYSTFASFGGDFAAGGKGGTGAEAQLKGTLASFFATGVAAQNLSKHPTLVNTAAKEGDKAPPENPVRALLGFMEETQVKTTTNATTVRKTCVDGLAKAAKLSEASNKIVTGLGEALSPKAWVEKLYDKRDDLKGDLAGINFMAGQLGADIVKRINDKDNGVGREAAIKEVCA